MKKTTDPGTAAPSAFCSARQTVSTSYGHNDQLLSTMIAEAHEHEVVHAKSMLTFGAQASLDVTHADLIACQWIDIKH
jgi:hypothetical protein